MLEAEGVRETRAAEANAEATPGAAATGSALQGSIHATFFKIECGDNGADPGPRPC